MPVYLDTTSQLHWRHRAQAALDGWATGDPRKSPGVYLTNVARRIVLGTLEAAAVRRRDSILATSYRAEADLEQRFDWIDRCVVGRCVALYCDAAVEFALQYLHRFDAYTSTGHVLARGAGAHCDLPTLKLIMSRSYAAIAMNVYDIARDAARQGRVDILEWLIASGFRGVFDPSVGIAAANHTPTLRWLLDRGGELGRDSGVAMSVAVNCLSSESFWLLVACGLRPTDRVWRTAAAGDSADALRWLVAGVEARLWEAPGANHRAPIAANIMQSGSAAVVRFALDTPVLRPVFDRFWAEFLPSYRDPLVVGRAIARAIPGAADVASYARHCSRQHTGALGRWLHVTYAGAP